MPKIWIPPKGHVSVNNENIYVRKVGNGSKAIILIPGNNTSGGTFKPILDYFDAVYDKDYSVYTLDYRGSGYSSYENKIMTLYDFASDFNKVIKALEVSESTLKKDVTIVGYSMGFGVSLAMLINDPHRYSRVISLAGISTRGYRVAFMPVNAGTDCKGNTWAVGDWVSTYDYASGLAATNFQQRIWADKRRTYTNTQKIWDATVFNDILKYDLSTGQPTNTTFCSNPAYENCYFDALTVNYMPESLYACHLFNPSAHDLQNMNQSKEIIFLKGTNSIKDIFKGKSVLIIKTKTDFANFRGDVVIDDQYFKYSIEDIKQSGGIGFSLLIDPDQGYDHGFPIAHPDHTVNLLHAFIQGKELTDKDIGSRLNVKDFELSMI